MPDSDGRRDVIEVLTHDHHEVEEMFVELEATTDPDARRKLADRVIIELVRHSVAEEQYVYPAAREFLPDGDDLVDHEIEEHSEAEQTMKDLESLDAEDPRFDRLLAQLMEEIRHHIRDEEQDLFPRLRDTLSSEQLGKLGAQVEKAKKLAPTRPHPSAPDTPPGNKLLGPGAGLIDRMRDALTGRGQ